MKYSVGRTLGRNGCPPHDKMRTICHRMHKTHVSRLLLLLNPQFSLFPGLLSILAVDLFRLTVVLLRTPHDKDIFVPVQYLGGAFSCNRRSFFSLYFLTLRPPRSWSLLVVTTGGEGRRSKEVFSEEIDKGQWGSSLFFSKHKVLVLDQISMRGRLNVMRTLTDCTHKLHAQKRSSLIE